eukprot:gene41737-65875_t
MAIPALHWLARKRLGAWDDLAGDLSYGVFLNHFLLIWLLFPAPGHTPLQCGWWKNRFSLGDGTCESLLLESVTGVTTFQVAG